MTVVGRLSSIGTFFAYDYDETVVTKFRIGSDGTAYSNEFDENTSTTLSGSKRMSATSTGGLIVLDSINEVDPFTVFVPSTDYSADAVVLYNDAAISYSISNPIGQQAYTTAGTFTFTVPIGVTEICAVCVGGGGGGGGGDGGIGETNSGGGGGGLSYGNAIAVTPGEGLTVVVGAGGNSSNGGDGSQGGNTTISSGATILLSGGGGGGGQNRNNGSGAGGSSGGLTRAGGGTGGAGGTGSNNSGGTGGGGAGGYTGNGGAGGAYNAVGSASAGGGGGGGGGYSGTTANIAGGGGGVGILGSGSNETGGTTSGGGGGGGSGGTAGGGNTSGLGGQYGGGGGGRADNAGTGGAGRAGAARIIWGFNRAYPANSVTDQAPIDYSVTLNDLTGLLFPNSRSGASVNGGYWSSDNTGVVNFDGVDDYITYSGYKGILGTGARTSIVWFKVNTPNVFYRLFGWGTTTAGSKWNLSLDTTTYKVRTEIGTGAVTAGTTAPSVIDGKWHMVATSCPNNGTANDIKIYIDGNLITDVTVTSGATAINTASGSDVSLGASLADVSPGYFSGQISSFLVYARQLSDLEIKQLYRMILNRY